MNTKSFLKIVWLTCTVFLLNWQTLFSQDTADKWYYGRSVYRYKKDIYPGKTFYKFNSMLFKLITNSKEMKVVHEVLIADQQKDFPRGSFAIYRTEYTYKHQGNSIFKRADSVTQKKPKLLTRRSYPDFFFHEKDELFLHPDVIDLSQLGSKGDKKLRISKGSLKDSFSISGQFNMNRGEFIKTSDGMTLAPYSHRTDAWIKMDELTYEKEIETYIAEHPLRSKTTIAAKKKNPEKKIVSGSGFATNTQPTDEIKDTETNEKPKRKSFLANFKKKEAANDNQRMRSFSKYLKKYRVTEYEKEKEFFKILEVTLSGSLKKGQVITFYYAQSETASGTSDKTVRWERKYKLLDDFRPKATIRLQNISGKNEGFVDELQSIRCYELFKETYMLLSYSKNKSVKLKASLW